MSATTWSKFFWSDWESDEALKMCSPAAQALWMRMLCICAKAKGLLIIKDHRLGPEEMARQTGWPLDDVRAWWAELDRWEVFSVDGRGRVYSRRMVKAEKKAQTARENGKNGGNPSLGNNKGNSASDNQNRTDMPTKRPGSTPEAISLEVSEAKASSSPSADTAVNYPELFEAAWKAFPHIRGRSSKSKSLAAWRRLPAATRSQLPSAIARYRREGREPNADCGAPAMERWLRDSRFLDWLTEGASAPVADERARRLDHFARTGLWRESWGPRPEATAA